MASTTDALPLTVTYEVRDNCLCLHVQRAARALARRFDEAFRPLGLTSGQFSLLISLNRDAPANIAQVSQVLGMDPSTVNANLKPLERRGLVEIAVDESDRRSRLVTLTDDGRAVLVEAVPIWRRTMAEAEDLVGDHADAVRADLRSLAD